MPSLARIRKKTWSLQGGNFGHNLSWHGWLYDLAHQALVEPESTVEWLHHCCKSVTFCQSNGHSGLGWLTCLEAHDGFTSKSVCGERADIDGTTCEQWLSEKAHKFLALYSLDDMFNADETVLHFKLLPWSTKTTAVPEGSGARRDSLP